MVFIFEINSYFIKNVFLTPINFFVPSNIYSKERKWKKNDYEKTRLKSNFTQETLEKSDRRLRKVR